MPLIFTYFTLKVRLKDFLDKKISYKYFYHIEVIVMFWLNNLVMTGLLLLLSDWLQQTFNQSNAMKITRSLPGSSTWTHLIKTDNIPTRPTNCITMLSPATAHRTSNAISSFRTSQFNFDWKTKAKK